MSRKKLVLIIGSVIAVAAIAGAIVSAQESTPTTWYDDQQPTTAPESFSFFISDGAFLGVGAEDITKENMARYGLREVRGVRVTQVIKDSPAEKAGLRQGDVIVRFDGESVTSVRKLTRLVNESSADQTVHLTISRGGSEQELTVTLAKHEFPGALRTGIRDGVLRGIENGFPRIEMGKFGDGNFVFAFSNRRIGVSTETLTKQLADYFGVKDGGVLITSVSENSPAAKAGLKAGDVITAIDGEKVTSPGDITRALSKKETGDVSLTVVRDRNTRTVTVTPEKRSEPNLIRPGTIGTRRVIIPSIQFPAVPPVDIQIPPVNVPATPPIEVTVPSRAPRARGVII